MALLFVALAAFVQIGIFLNLLNGAGAINMDYYKFSSLAYVEIEENLAGQFSPQYLNFTSNLDNIFVNYTNGIYVVTSGGAEYVITKNS